MVAVDAVSLGLELLDVPQSPLLTLRGSRPAAAGSSFPKKRAFRTSPSPTRTSPCGRRACGRPSRRGPAPLAHPLCQWSRGSTRPRSTPSRRRQPFLETVDEIFYLGRRDGIVCLRAPGGSAAVAPSGAVAAGAEVDHGEQHDHADGGKLHEARRAARAPDDEHRHEDERDARPPGGPVS
jgi:hypothetical protein